MYRRPSKISVLRNVLGLPCNISPSNEISFLHILGIRFWDDGRWRRLWSWEMSGGGANLDAGTCRRLWSWETSGGGASSDAGRWVKFWAGITGRVLLVGSGLPSPGLC